MSLKSKAISIGTVRLMMMLLLCPLLLFGIPSVFSQTITVVTSDSATSIRGLSVVSEKVIWASGSSGKVARSIDGGNTWNWQTVAGFEKRDFRDIEAFDKNTAVIMAVAEPAVILRTTNGGENWEEVYRNDTPGMFLDAMEFWNKESGIVIGDPINGRFFIARSFDGGQSWKKLQDSLLPVADSGEACFAASGTNVRSLSRSEACFVTGGKRSRLFWKGEPITLPIIQGSETTGANSVAVRGKLKYRASKHLVIVGGDFQNDTSSHRNCVVTSDGGKTWIHPLNPPRGYRSCVEYISKKRLITCGTKGVDVSSDGGMTWSGISNDGFHVVRKSKKGGAVYLAGSRGRIARLDW